MRSSLKYLFIITALSLCFASGRQALAETSQPGCLSTDPNCYVLLSPLPLSNPSQPGSPDQTTNPSAYIKGIIDLAIAVAGGFAVLRLIIAGFQYITTENFSGKSNARGTMNNAIIGLLLVIASFTVLQTIGQFDSSGQSVFTDLGLTVSPIKEQQAINVASSTCLGPIVNGTCTTPSATSTSLTPTSPTSGGACNGSPGSTCVETQVFGFPQKGPGAGCSGTACYIDPALGQKLADFTTALGHNGIYYSDWIVTEMDPPTDPGHVSSCHTNGTCVDAKLVQNNPDPHTVYTFLQTLSAQGLTSFLYEAPSCARLKTLQSSSYLVGLKNQIKFCKSTQGENVHINLSGGTGGSCGTATDGTSNEVQC